MPVTIAIFINPGHRPEMIPGQKTRGRPPSNAWNSNNRSFEYDTLSDQYAKFLLEEILPEVGKEYKIDRQGRGPGDLRASAPAGSAPLPSPGSARTRSARCSATSAAFTNIRGGATFIRP